MSPETLVADKDAGGVAVDAETRSAEAARIDAVDLLRGLVMVIMALDHTRDYFTNVRFNPTDLQQTTPALYLTRWMTHFCAPTFVLLAGAGAYLYGARRRHRGELSRFLLTRGLWLVVVELTIVRFGWLFRLDAPFFPWPGDLGHRLVDGGDGRDRRPPAGVVGLLGVAIIAGHNLLDGWKAADFGPFGWLWTILHDPGSVELGGGWRLHAPYSVLPWLGVMMAGYGFGPWLIDPVASRRRRRLLLLGGVLTGLFVLIRLSNRYGDPNPWTVQTDALRTVFSFVDCAKYPPSLLYLLMTLGPAIAAIPLLERWRGPLAHRLITFGRVPLFFYVLHLYVIHAGAILAALVQLGPSRVRALLDGPFGLPEDYGYGLPGVYLAWLAVLCVLYPACRWFADLKRRRRDWTWLSYL